MASRPTAKILICCDCGEEFVVTVDAQEYFADRGYIRNPKRCKTCFSAAKRNERRNGSTTTNPSTT
ncbi:MAG: cytochrome C551 [Candidatus Zixiibacteriota bacterium]|nr:MAG: cytochrome C551 [candidate division Zixibacteria bacterium]